MKDAYILFQNRKPKNKDEMLNLVRHFCLEHGLSYTPPTGSNKSLVGIDGECYQVHLKKGTEEPGLPYWMLYCSHLKSSTL